MLTRRVEFKFNGSNDMASSTENIMNSKFVLARTNTIKTFLFVGIFFVICWSFDEIFYLMYNLGYNSDFNSTFYKFSVLMVFLNCTINPFIYLFKYQDYQQALKELFGCKRQNMGEDSELRRDHSSSGTATSNQTI